MRALTIGGALVIGSMSLLPLGVLPILLGGLNEAGRLSKAGIGQAAMLELFGLALGATVGGYWMGRAALRLKTAAAALGLVVINVGTAHAGSEAIVLLDRAVAGVLAGLLCGAANAVIVRAKNPDRLFGVLSGGALTPGIALAYLIPVFLIPKFGVGAGFYTLAATMLVASLFAFVLEDSLSNLTRPESVEGRPNWPSLLFAGAIVLQSCGLGAAWMYIERLAHQHDFNPSVAGLAIAGSVAIQTIAAWLSAWLAPKVAKRPVLFLLLIAQTGFIALAILAGSPAAFIVAVGVFGGAATGMQAFQVAEIIMLDVTRRTAVLVGPLILFGGGLGPLVASFVTTEADVRGGVWAGVAMTAASALAHLAALRAARPDVPPLAASRS